MSTPVPPTSAISPACLQAAPSRPRMSGSAMPPERHDIALTVNGVSYRGSVEARTLLSDFLRHDLRLAGTHVGCEHGVCGACTVLLDGAPVRSCLMLAVQADGHALMTVEGLAGDAE